MATSRSGISPNLGRSDRKATEIANEGCVSVRRDDEYVRRRFHFSRRGRLEHDIWKPHECDRRVRQPSSEGRSIGSSKGNMLGERFRTSHAAVTKYSRGSYSADSHQIGIKGWERRSGSCVAAVYNVEYRRDDLIEEQAMDFRGRPVLEGGDHI